MAFLPHAFLYVDRTGPASWRITSGCRCGSRRRLSGAGRTRGLLSVAVTGGQ